jgi:hypothetical protein
MPDWIEGLESPFSTAYSAEVGRPFHHQSNVLKSANLQILSLSGMVETPRLQAKKSLAKWSRK